VSRTGLSPSYLGCGRLTTEGYGSARRERVHGLHQFLMSMSVGRYHCIQSLGAPGHDCADERKIGPLMAMEIKPSL
jgi:hypothetical protein